MREAVEARVELGVCADALRDAAVDALADLVAGIFPGILVYIWRDFEVYTASEAF